MREQKPIQCIGIILDGNRRWAKEKGLPTLEGHRRGFEKLKEAARWVRDRGIPHLAVFAFSTENWNRSEEEVAGLMGMMKEAARADTRTFAEEGIRIRFAGERERLEPETREALGRAEVESASQSRLTLWVCLSYGGRAEIVTAARAAAEKGEVNEESVAANLWMRDMPDPAIVVRTGGQKRLSNFLPWQSVYSELFFLDTLWPDFGEEDLEGVLSEFKERKRNFGI